LPPARLRAVIERGLKVEQGCRTSTSADERRLPRTRGDIFQAVRVIGEGRTAGRSRVDHLVDRLARHIDHEGMIDAAHGVPGRLRNDLTGRDSQGQSGESASREFHSATCRVENFSRASVSL
jgi:hypothetical protein